ncbi:hypothetical protein EVJ58_g3943 [Rhodofomes roseus]|uniref:Uncharacterized protein n=1 Tax=Rhodofomes roseus TaxID=34475 RepID=A0A4Y9YKR0_9APHY|nr:hypothetical protein EVJ58_g3943 [Rhodofomes roseus]
MERIEPVDFIVNTELPATVEPQLQSRYALARRELFAAVDALTADQAEQYVRESTPRPRMSTEEEWRGWCTEYLDPDAVLSSRAPSQAPSESLASNLNARMSAPRFDPVAREHIQPKMPEFRAPPATPSRKPRSTTMTPQSSPSKRKSMRLQRREDESTQAEKKANRADRAAKAQAAMKARLEAEYAIRSGKGGLARSPSKCVGTSKPAALTG